MEEAHRLTEAVLVKSLAEEFQVKEDEVKLTSFEVSGGSEKGDNFSCVMKKVKMVADVKGQPRGQTYNYLAKCFPMNEWRIKWLKESHFFVKEVLMYKEMIPLLNAEIDDPERRIRVPKTFYADHEEGILIMEDLKLRGFYMPDKIAGMKDAEIRLTMQQLARLHATSYHFLEQFGVDKFKEKYPVRNITCSAQRRSISDNSCFVVFVGEYSKILI